MSDPSPEPRPDKLHEFSSAAIRVTWSKRRCIHAAECVRNLPVVFAPGEKPWIRTGASDADQIATVVERCPTGALHHERLDGGAAEPLPAENTVQVTRNGPLYLRGRLELVTREGAVAVRDTRVALCRCGASRNKPFCDNSHLTMEFIDRGEVFEGGVKPALGDKGPDTLQIHLTHNGPLQLRGPLRVLSADRRVSLEGGAASLCRCGQSRNKPFCDGSHTGAGFISE